MDSDQIKSLSGQLQALVKANNDFPQKLEKRLISTSSKVENQFKFIVELFNEGVLRDGSSDVVSCVQLSFELDFYDQTIDFN